MSTFTGTIFQSTAYPTEKACAAACLVDFLTAGGDNTADEALETLGMFNDGEDAASEMSAWDWTPHTLIVEEWGAVRAAARAEILGD